MSNYSLSVGVGGVGSDGPDANCLWDGPNGCGGGGRQGRGKGNGNGGGGVLPSFSDILWCTDVDGDVMSSGLDAAMVRENNIVLQIY